MSERGLYVLDDGTYVRTQAEIPKGQKVRKVGIPVDSKGLCDFLNQLIATERAANTGTLPSSMEPEHLHDDAAQVEEIPTPAPPAAPKTDEAEMRRKLALSLRDMEVDAIEDKILEAKPNTLARFLLCAIGRLGELGRDGWEHVQAHRHFPGNDCEKSQAKDKFKHLPMYNERGLRYLALMVVEDLNGKAEA